MLKGNGRVQNTTNASGIAGKAEQYDTLHEMEFLAGSLRERCKWE